MIFFQILFFASFCVLSIRVFSYYNKNIKKGNNVIYIDNFSKINCYTIYIQYLSNHHKVSFEEYIEYWWDTEETFEELQKRVCIKLYKKYCDHNINNDDDSNNDNDNDNNGDNKLNNNIISSL